MLTAGAAGAAVTVNLATNPMRRTGQMPELQNLATFLMADGAEWLTGETIAIDGGGYLANGGSFTDLDKLSDEDWDRIVELNLTSCMALTRAVVPQMKARRWGRIIYISSIMGLASNPARGCYSATKAALIGMARAQALELRLDDVERCRQRRCCPTGCRSRNEVVECDRRRGRRLRR